jgi:putative ABC transport system ATP-binding protein
MKSPRLRAVGLLVKRAGVDVVAQLDLDVQQGESVSISGPSGCGKSTLLRALSRLEPIAQGQLLLDGHPMASIPAQLWRKRVSLVLQNSPMFEGTVADNVRFGPSQRGELLSEADVQSLLERVALPAGMARRDAMQMSGGERQRVALARALANEPDVLLLDEPTSALDPNAAHEVIGQVRELARRGLSVVAVLHVIEHAKLLGTRHLRMHQGKFLSEAST